MCNSVTEYNRVHNGCKFPRLILIIWNYWIPQKDAEISNFCLIEKILHNFPMSISIDSASETFVSIQMLFYWRGKCKGMSIKREKMGLKLTLVTSSWSRRTPSLDWRRVWWPELFPMSLPPRLSKQSLLLSSCRII